MLVSTDKKTYAQDFIRNMNEDLNDVKRSFIKIGFRLTEANENEYYKELGYQNIVELAEAEFGFKSSTTYEFMKVYELAHDSNCLWHIAEKYDKYSYSQLLALTYLKSPVVNAISIVRPSDSVRNIKKFVSIWNREARLNGYYDQELKTVEDYLKAYDKERAKEQVPQISEYAGQLPGQIALELSEPEENFSERSEKFEPEPAVREEPVMLMPDSELTKFCLKDESCLKKFRIVRAHAELVRSAFVRFVKDSYGNGGHGGPDLPYKFIDYTPSGGYSIHRLTGGKIVLAWASVAGYISRMIEADEYLTDKEKEQYVQWQAEYDGFAVSLPTKQEEPEENFSERSEKSTKEVPVTNISYLRTLCVNDFAKLVSKRICELPDTFGEGMPYEERVCKWLSIWLTLAPPKNEGGE